MGERAFIVTQSIKKLRAEDRGWALDKKGFKRLSDDKPADISNLPEDDSGLYYKDMPYTRISCTRGLSSPTLQICQIPENNPRPPDRKGTEDD